MKKLLFIFLNLFLLQSSWSIASESKKESVCCCGQMYEWVIRKCIQADVSFGLNVTGLTPKELMKQAFKTKDPIRIDICKKLITTPTSPISVADKKIFEKIKSE